MTIRRNQRITRRSAAHALDHAGTSGVPKVDEILAAASAPASGFELNREAETVAVFRSVVGYRAAAATTRFQRARARLAAAPVLVASSVAVMLVGGGVAVAASTGNLPEILGGSHRSDTGAAHASQAPGQNKSPNAPEATHTPAGTPSPSLVGQCRKFQAGATSHAGTAGNTPAFNALVKAAGGKENVSAYCVNLIGAPGSHPTATPTHPTRPVHPTPTPPVPTVTPPHPHPTHPAKPTDASTNSRSSAH